GPSVLIGLALVVLIELGQLFVYSRISDTTDILLGTAGAGLGVWLARRWWTGDDARATAAGPLASAWPWLALAVLYATVLCAIFWDPFDFTRDGSLIRERLGAFVRLPFAAMYAGTDLDAM